ncbi:hypothetical protein FACS1894116_10900 [Betaproteobacteria bacterium]|nr:hypothetical protein FACS1894116_10900 [Betaproteobacteria bacterium]GHT99773.1 hypothetical protein FACS1894154_07530 [Betaproteobacteria bacterium]GHU25537.1 hypothetical protein FACS189488_12820 [Betaproteobacteria bacterium]GHU30578.1 hypothetical protein FACS189497_10490 [Betaproteobacteria bacterium]
MQHDRKSDVCIKVVGVGGAGCSAVDYMLREGVQGVEFIAADTDASTLEHCQAQNKLALGELGTHGEVEAKARRELIAAQLSGANMVFVMADMGEAAGIAAASVVAKVARAMGVFTVGVVSGAFYAHGVHCGYYDDEAVAEDLVPGTFAFERNKRVKIALEVISELQKHAHSLLVIPNHIESADGTRGFDEHARVCQ